MLLAVSFGVSFPRPLMFLIRIAAGFTAFAALSMAAASAQPSNWTVPAPGSTSLLVGERPFSDDVDGLGAISSAWRFTVNQPLGPVRAIVELPFAFASADDNSITVDDVDTRTRLGAALGNLQLGVEVPLLVVPVRLGGYVRLPTSTESEGENRAGEEAALVGSLAGYEQPGLYEPKVVTVAGMAEVRPQVLAVPGLSFRLRAVPQVLLGSLDNSAVDGSEVYLGYAAQAFFGVGGARVGGGLSGISALGDRGAASGLALGVLGNVDLGAIRLGASARLPVAGAAADRLDGVVGVSLVFEAQ